MAATWQWEKKSQADVEIVHFGCGRERDQVKELKTKELKQE